MQAGLLISGINAEVMPGQWEFQIGPVGAPDVGDEVMIARWLLHRLGEQFGIVCTFHPKPVKGDWNGARLIDCPERSRRRNGGTCYQRHRGVTEAPTVVLLADI